jgi:hypothetical protein
MAVGPRKVWRDAEQKRALRLLAGSPHGATEAIMLAQTCHSHVSAQKRPTCND